MTEATPKPKRERVSKLDRELSVLASMVTAWAIHTDTVGQLNTFIALSAANNPEWDNSVMCRTLRHQLASVAARRQAPDATKH